MSPARLISMLIFTTLVCACSKPAEEKPSQERSSQERPAGVLTDAQQHTLDEAKKTQEVIDKASKERMKEVDEATGEK